MVGSATGPQGHGDQPLVRRHSWEPPSKSLLVLLTHGVHVYCNVLESHAIFILAPPMYVYILDISLCIEKKDKYTDAQIYFGSSVDLCILT